MSGVTLVHDRSDTQSIFKVWTPGSYYQKPTGMLCAPGKMFVAVQDLNSSDYGDAPAATLAVSLDSGQTWTEDTTAPMFDKHEFTTIMSLDYGQDRAWAVDAYIYVYGLDYNWRYSGTVTSPQGLYLARVSSVDALLTHGERRLRDHDPVEVHPAGRRRDVAAIQLLVVGRGGKQLRAADVGRG